MGKCGVEPIMFLKREKIKWDKLRDVIQSGSGTSTNTNGLYIVEVPPIEGANRFNFLVARFLVELNVTECLEHQGNSKKRIYISDGCSREIIINPQSNGSYGWSRLTVLKANDVQWAPGSGSRVATQFTPIPNVNYVSAADNIGRITVDIRLCSAEITVHHELYGGTFQ